MVNRKPSIYMRDPLYQLVESKAGKDGTSGVINTIAERYSEVLARNSPGFTLREMAAIKSALKDHKFRNTISNEVANLHLWMAQNGANRDLCERVQRLPFVKKVALIEAIEGAQQ